jgi:exosome complex exonuclease DIS3/RRP44
MTDDYETDDEQSLIEYPIKEAVSAPVLYSRSTYFRQAYKRVKIVKSVTEKYIREDLGFGCQFVDDENSALSEKRRQYVDEVVGRPKVIESIPNLLSVLQPCEPRSLVICDANVLLHNLDVLEQSGSVMPNLVIPQTALVECRANRVVAYDRTVQLIRSVNAREKTMDNNNTTTTMNNKTETRQAKRCCIFFPDPNHVETAFLSTEEKEYKSINDQNDARIRKVAEYFGNNLLNTGIRVILLTDDKRSRDIASKSKSYEAKSVRSWVRELESFNKNISLSDIVAHTGSEDTSTATNQHAETLHYEPHVTGETLSNGVKTGLYHRGVLRFVGNNKGFITIRRGEERVAVVIEGQNDLNRGVDGDVVAISIHPLEKWTKTSTEKIDPKKTVTNGIASDTAEPSTSEMCNVSDTLPIDNLVSLTPHGKVVGIIRRNLPTLSGTIVTTNSSQNNKSEREVIAEKYEREHVDGTTTCVFFAVSKHMPPILVRTSQRDRLVGHRIMVSMDSWPSTSPYPLGHYVRTIGLIGDKDVETQVLLYEHNIPHEPFPASVLACLPPDDYRIDAENGSGREDYRKLPILSIDPPGCKDIDDALHCIKLPSGNYEVGVHIADVTHYVSPGTAIDVEASNRSTSTYLVNKRLDMLPGLLTTDLCSLKENVDRYAFSVLWEMTPDAEIVNVTFKKSIIHSIAALTYQQAQSMIDQPDDDSDIQASAVKRLAAIARILRRKRIDAGALTLASPEVKCKCYHPNFFFVWLLLIVSSTFIKFLWTPSL